MDLESFLKSSGLNPCSRIRRESGADGVIANGGRSSLWLGRMWAGFRWRTSSWIQDLNREGINAYLDELGKLDNGVDPANATTSLKTMVQSHLADYLQRGKPLYFRKIQQFARDQMANVVIQETQELASKLNTPQDHGVQEKIKNQIQRLKLVQLHLDVGIDQIQFNQITQAIQLLNKNIIREENCQPHDQDPKQIERDPATGMMGERTLTEKRQDKEEKPHPSDQCEALPKASNSSQQNLEKQVLALNSKMHEVQVKFAKSKSINDLPKLMIFSNISLPLYSPRYKKLIYHPASYDIWHNLLNNCLKYTSEQRTSRKIRVDVMDEEEQAQKIQERADFFNAQLKEDERELIYEIIKTTWQCTPEDLDCLPDRRLICIMGAIVTNQHKDCEAIIQSADSKAQLEDLKAQMYRCNELIEKLWQKSPHQSKQFTPAFEVDHKENSFSLKITNVSNNELNYSIEGISALDWIDFLESLVRWKPDGTVENQDVNDELINRVGSAILKDEEGFDAGIFENGFELMPSKNAMLIAYIIGNKKGAKELFEKEKSQTENEYKECMELVERCLQGMPATNCELSIAQAKEMGIRKITLILLGTYRPPRYSNVISDLIKNMEMIRGRVVNFSNMKNHDRMEVACKIQEKITCLRKQYYKFVGGAISESYHEKSKSYNNKIEKFRRNFDRIRQLEREPLRNIQALQQAREECEKELVDMEKDWANAWKLLQSYGKDLLNVSKIISDPTKHHQITHKMMFDLGKYQYYINILNLLIKQGIEIGKIDPSLLDDEEELGIVNMCSKDLTSGMSQAIALMFSKDVVVNIFENLRYLDTVLDVKVSPKNPAVQFINLFLEDALDCSLHQETRAFFLNVAEKQAMASGLIPSKDAILSEISTMAVAGEIATKVAPSKDAKLSELPAVAVAGEIATGVAPSKDTIKYKLPDSRRSIMKRSSEIKQKTKIQFVGSQDIPEDRIYNDYKDTRSGDKTKK